MIGETRRTNGSGRLVGAVGQTENDCFSLAVSRGVEQTPDRIEPLSTRRFVELAGWPAFLVRSRFLSVGGAPRHSEMAS